MFRTQFKNHKAQKNPSNTERVFLDLKVFIRCELHLRFNALNLLHSVEVEQFAEQSLVLG